MLNNAIGKLLSASFQKRLDQALVLCDKAIFPRDVVSAHSRLRELFEILYPYCRIALFPDTVLVDLGESLQDIYNCRFDLDGECKHVEHYLHKSRKAHSDKPILDKMDNMFTAWLHTDGYYAQQDHMYELLQETLYDIHNHLKQT